MFGYTFYGLLQRQHSIVGIQVFQHFLGSSLACPVIALRTRAVFDAQEEEMRSMQKAAVAQARADETLILTQFLGLCAGGAYSHIVFACSTTADKS